MPDFEFLHDENLIRRLIALGVRPADCVERFVLGGGPGGQKVNKTSSTVHLQHRPSGFEVRLQRERSQTRNRELAWEELAARLEAARAANRAAQRDELERARRQHRQKSRGQKARMIQSKKHRSRIKSNRRGGPADA